MPEREEDIVVKMLLKIKWMVWNSNKILLYLQKNITEHMRQIKAGGHVSIVDYDSFYNIL